MNKKLSLGESLTKVKEALDGKHYFLVAGNDVNIDNNEASIIISGNPQTLCGEAVNIILGTKDQKLAESASSIIANSTLNLAKMNKEFGEQIYEALKIILGKDTNKAQLIGIQ